MLKGYDIAVLGASAAGYAAALVLARQGREVVVLDAPASRMESPLADWIPSDLMRACPPLEAIRSSATESAFRAVTFHSPTFDRQATYRQRGAAGFMLRSNHLLAAMAKAADKAGVRRVKLHSRPRLDLQEACVTVRAGRPVTASLLLIAQGSPEEMTADLALPGRGAPPARMTVCGLDAPLPPGRLRGRLDDALHVIAFPGGEQMGMFFVAGAVVHIRILSSGQQGVGVEALSRLIAGLQQGGILPARLDLGRARAAIWHPPGGAALELETHLAKRTLLVGTAGGFASAVTGQTLDPSVRSALVAAEVARRALRSPRPQEVLADYKTQWRELLANRIRATGMSLQMLMPMVLTNQAMTERFARALLYGTSI